MSLNESDVAKIAHLSRLDIDQTEQYAEDLSKILDLIAKMNELDTESIEPMAHPQDVTQRLRTDTVSEPDQHAAFQAIAPETAAGLYLVPKVID